jgi:hypothetical protein
VCTREQVFGDRAAEGLGIRHSFPVIASGQVRTYAWERVGRIAELSLWRTCALLSLFTGTVWIPRTNPRQRPESGDRMQVPPVIGPTLQLPGHLQEPEWHGEIPPDTEFYELPE